MGVFLPFAATALVGMQIGLVMTLVILRVTWQSWRTVSRTDPGEMIEPHER